MKIDCLSDLHGHYSELEGGDLLIIAGDLTASDEQKQLDEFDEWLCHQPYKKKIFIGGNHDNLLIKELPKKYMMGTKDNKIERCEYLCDSGTTFQGLKIWGSPWTHLFPGVNPHCTAFMIPECALEDKWALIPDNTDILITHSPPLDILDKNKNKKKTHCGSESLYQRLNRLKNLKLHVFGHIHEGYGHIPKILDFPGIQFVNASHVDGDYEPVNNPIRIVL